MISFPTLSGRTSNAPLRMQNQSADMNLATILKHFAAALVSLALMFSAPTAIAASMGSGCDDQMLAMDAPSQSDMASGHKMPCDKAPGICAAICADMASVGISGSQMNLTMPTLTRKTNWQFQAMRVGISRRPDLPPPITIT